MERFLAAILLRTVRQVFTTLIVLSASAYMSGSRGADGVHEQGGQALIGHHAPASTEPLAQSQ